MEGGNRDRENGRMESKKGALLGKYEVGRLLGCGAFAKVYYGRNLGNGQSVAIKVINKKKIAGSSLMSNIKREICIMRRLRHPNIVRLYEVLASKSKIYFVMEYVKGGELFTKVAKGRFSEDLARKFFQQLISAVGYCHSRGVYHRDLKPENLLVDEKGDLKVSDFGLSAVKEKEMEVEKEKELLHTLCGTPAYVAPEILGKKGYQGSKVDIWSCGVVLYVLTAGYLPFNDPNLMAMYKKIYKGEFKCPKWMSSDLKRFLSRLLDSNPNTRISIDHIIRDPWFTDSKHSSAPTFTFSFCHDYYDCDDDADSDMNASPKQPLLESSTAITPSPINAFHLIAFSSGLDLSSLFDPSFNPILDAHKFVSAQPAPNILAALEEVAQRENLNLHLNGNKDWGADLRGPNSNFVAKLEIRPLTDQLVVVEVKKRAGDSDSYNHVWKNMVRPLLSRLLHHSDSLVTTQPPPDPQPPELSSLDSTSN